MIKNQILCLELEPQNTLLFEISAPMWDETLSSEAAKGLDRQPDGSLDDHFKNFPELKRKYNDHRAFVAKRFGYHGGSIQVWGCRNAVNNPGYVIWDIRYERPLFCREDEPLGNWPYFGVMKHEDGSSTMEKVRFPSRNAIEVERAKNGSAPVWFASGLPLLADGVVMSPATLAALSYHSAHVFHIISEPWQVKKWPDRNHLAAHRELTETFSQLKSSPVLVRAEAMAAVVARHGLRVEDQYLHSVIGVRGDGTVVPLMMRGSCQNIATFCRDHLGLRDAVSVDQGGSVGLAVFSPDKLTSERLAEGEPQAVVIGNGPLFRPRGVACFVAEVTGALEGAYVPGPYDGEVMA